MREAMVACIVFPLLLALPTRASAGEDLGCVSDALAAQNAYTAVSACVGAPASGPSETPASNNPGASAVTFSHEPVCERGEGEGAAAFYGCGSQAQCGDGGLESWVWQHTPTSSEIVGITCIEPGEAEPQAVLTPGRILEAFRRIPVPSPSIGVNPVGGRTLVNFDTILHTEAEPFTETVQLLGRRVTFEIEPSEFSWRTGQGDGFTTSDPGQAYQASLPMSAYVTHRYLRAGDVQLGLDTTWTARWRVGDGPWRPVDGTVTTSSDPVPLEVVTARPQLVSYD